MDVEQQQAFTTILAGVLIAMFISTIVWWLGNERAEVTLGPDEYPNCQVTVSLEVLDTLNDMGLWSWIVRCVDETEAQARQKREKT